MVNTNCIVTATTNLFSCIIFFSKIEHHPVNLLQEGKCIFVSVSQTLELITVKYKPQSVFIVNADGIITTITKLQLLIGITFFSKI